MMFGRRDAAFLLGAVLGGLAGTGLAAAGFELNTAVLIGSVIAVLGGWLTIRIVSEAKG